MADADSSREEINNGFRKVCQFDIVGHCHIEMSNAKTIANLFAAIKRLASNDPEIVGLAEHGKCIADGTVNDTSVLLECATEAGVIGFHVEEGVSHV